MANSLWVLHTLKNKLCECSPPDLLKHPLRNYGLAASYNFQYDFLTFIMNDLIAASAFCHVQQLICTSQSLIDGLTSAVFGQPGGKSHKQRRAQHHRHLRNESMQTAQTGRNLTFTGFR